jgi:hypothetical protein
MMSPWAESLGPVIITGFALQQLLELIDPLLDKLAGQHKSWLHSLLAFVVSLALCLLLDLRALRPFGVTRLGVLDTFLTALLITGGTRWVNDLVKVLSYKKFELRQRSAHIAVKQNTHR